MANSVSNDGQSIAPATQLFRLEGSVASYPEKNVLQLRRMNPVGGFVQAIDCNLGNITAIVELDLSSEKVFRQALFGEKTSSQIDIRFGARPVHPSEIMRCDDAEKTFEERTVEEFLGDVGAPATLIPSILQDLQLAEFRNDVLADLERGALQRLLVIAPLFSKGQFLHFDDPFRELNNHWIEKLGELLLEAARISKKVFVVTGSMVIPDCWAKSKAVSTYICRGDTLELFSPRRQQQEDPFNNWLSAVCEARDVRNCIITRPQVISRRALRGAMRETLQHEAIRNPEIVSHQETSLLDSGNVPAVWRKERSASSLTRLPLSLKVKRWIKSLK